MNKHQFVTITETSKMPDVVNHAIQRGIPGVTVVCAICGEIRKVYEDGEVVVVKLGDDHKHLNDQST